MIRIKRWRLKAAGFAGAAFLGILMGNWAFNAFYPKQTTVQFNPTSADPQASATPDPSLQNETDATPMPTDTPASTPIITPMPTPETKVMSADVQNPNPQTPEPTATPTPDATPTPTTLPSNINTQACGPGPNNTEICRN